MSHHNSIIQAGMALYRSEQVRSMDRVAIDRLGISGLELMHRAGREAFQVLASMCSERQPIAVFCGAGNNAGDGYVVARLALDAGHPVTVFPIVSPDHLRGDAAAAYREFLEQGGSLTEFEVEIPKQAGVVVDALLGTGLDREVSGRIYEVIEEINRYDGRVLALDIPSGLNADSGFPMGIAVCADQTVTFIGAKQGLYTGDGVEYSGVVTFASLDVPAEVCASEQPSSVLLASPHAAFGPRRRAAHKGDFGHLLIVGGEAGYSGAARMAAQAGARVGAGLVSLATRSCHAAFINLAQPELMCHAVESAEDLRGLLDKANAVGVGPGLGQGEWGKALFECVIDSGLKVVVDADALNLLAENPLRRSHWVLTPHPGEAARLLGCDTLTIRKDRFAAATAIQEKYGGICVLKGAGSLVADGGTVAICPSGNPGMASGGMGDLLTGMIAGLIAQGFSIGDAARAGVYLHGEAADLAARNGERGMLATDLLPFIRDLVNP
ncbi:MAG: NAD(P)H-hydrate dehydratase [Methylococcaceae bacterium]|nr:NAD(P)H-hydrate dehydratase [Methylococcaceae bacterium]